MAMAFAATIVLVLAVHSGPSGSLPVTDQGTAGQVSVAMSETELAGAIGGKPAYCDKALASCMDGCGNWGWLSPVFVVACNSGCYYGYNQCGGAS
jgi:hypothetical protein